MLPALLRRGAAARAEAALYRGGHGGGAGAADYADRSGQHGNLAFTLGGRHSRERAGFGLSRGKTFLLTLNESKYALFSAYLLGFGRAMAEVGAVSMVGGAIAYKTNVMTTAIMMYTNMGNFSYALALGILLLLISLFVNVLAHLLQRSVGV